MPIYYYTEDVKLPSFFKKRKLSQWINEIATIHEKKLGAISYIFCSDLKILEINQEYLQHDYYTDIISFDYSENILISGDLFISLDTVKSNSEKYNSNYNEELFRVIIHGVLHLCGFKDESDVERTQMTLQENNALELLNKILTT